MRVAGGADVLGAHESGAGQAERAAQETLAGALGHRVGLTGQQRFVHLQPAAFHQRTVHGDPIPGRQHDQVATDDCLGVDLDDGALAAYADTTHRQRRDAVQRALGPQLLHDADHDVEDHRAAGEQRVAEDDASAGRRAQTECQGTGERGEQGHVEDGEDVVADDVPDASRLRWRRDVALAAREPVRHLGVGEACGRVLHGAHDPGASSPRRGRRPRGSEKQGSRARRGAAGPDRARRACQHSSTVARAHSARGREPSRNAGRRRGSRHPRYNGGHAMPGPP